MQVQSTLLSNDRSFDNTNNASTVDVPQFNFHDITSDFEYYLNRIDKIFMTREESNLTLENASALNPLEPGNLDVHMLFATLQIPSYTLDTRDVIVDKEDNRRYTMRDIIFV